MLSAVTTVVAAITGALLARMIPPICSDATRSPGEVELFAELRDDPSTEGWIVLHSLDLAEHVARVSGEVDFVIIVPGLGVVCLEVKAHRTVRRRDGLWFLGSATEPDERGPFKQAAEASHSLRERATRAVDAARGVSFYSAVCFPYVTFDDASPEWHPWQVIDQAALRSRGLSASVQGVLRQARDHLQQRTSWFDPDAPEPTAATVHAIAEALRGDFEVHESPRARRRRLHDEVFRYTQEQLRALDQVEDNPRVLFDGPAGTGKSVLAVESARRAAERGDRVLLLCFNRHLSRRLAAETEGVEGITTKTIHRHLLDLAGMSRPEGANSEFWRNELPELAVDALLQETSPYDVVILDEVQDLAHGPYLDVLDLQLRDGLAHGRWVAFGDVTNQAIYEGDEAGVAGLLESRGVAFTRFALRTNCRNTPRTASYAQLLGALDRGYVSTLRPDDGTEPRTRMVRAADDPAQVLTDVLDELREDGFEHQDIVVLSTVRDGTVRGVKSAPWGDRLTPLGEDRPGCVRYGTIHEFKGLEAPAVVLTDIGTLARPRDRRLVYVGATRALLRLVVLVDSSAGRDLAGILSEEGNDT